MGEHMLADLKEIDIKNLSEMYDLGSRESFVSLYMNLEKTNERFVEKRKKACRSVLKENNKLIENFDKTMQTIEKYLVTNDGEDGQKGHVIFASNETFGLVVLDSHRARIYVVSSGKIEDKDRIAKDIMNKHKKGGMSQARFQRLRQGAIQHFLKEVSEGMVKLFSKDNVVKIIIAGPGEAKILLMNFLPNELKDLLLDLIDADFDEADGELVSKAEEAVQKDDKETVSNDVAQLNEEILKHSLAVYGLNEVIDAVKNGQIELLLVSIGHKLSGWICEKCQLFDSGINDKCPNCSGNVAEVDVIEEIIDFAKRTGAKIDFVDDNPILQDLGGVGGLLRFNV
jgi:peptide chain release factor subunit 1